MHKAISSAVLVVVIALVVGHGSAGGAPTGASEGIVVERKGDLYAVAVDGTWTVQLTKTPTFELDPTVSADGRSVAYKRPPRGTRHVGSTMWPDFAQLGQIWTMEVGGARRVRVTSGGDIDPAWSPDDDAIVFSHYVPLGRYGIACPVIFGVESSGRNSHRVTRLGGGQYDAAVSPDGGRIAFTWSSGCEGGTVTFALGVVDGSGRPTSDLAQLPGNASFSFNTGEYLNPTWAPDGSRLAFEGGVRYRGRIYRGVLVANLDGSGLQQVTPPRMNAKDPAWSLDGEWIAFVRSGDGPGDLYVIHPDGTGLRQLTRTEARESSPAWLPHMPTR